MFPVPDKKFTMNLKEIIEWGESETCEFKKSTSQLERALKSICAFLNHKGGVVYFGVNGNKKNCGTNCFRSNPEIHITKN